MDFKKAPIYCQAFYNSKITGGWGLIKMQACNKAAILKLLWAITFKADKLWTQWINAYYLIRHTILNVSINSNISWGRRKII